MNLTQQQLQRCVPFAHALQAEYIGNGNWSKSANWLRMTHPRDTDGLALVNVKSGVTAIDSSLSLYPINALRDVVDVVAQTSIFGQAGVRRVPLNTRVAVETAGNLGAFVGENQPTPISQAAFTTATVAPYRIQCAFAITKELFESRSHSVAETIANTAVRNVRNAMERYAFSPGIAAVAGTNPASLTYGVSATQLSGTTAAAIASGAYTAMSQAASGGTMTDPVYVTSTQGALILASKTDADGSLAFPFVRVDGTGTFCGAPLLVSDAIPWSASGGTLLIAMDAGAVLLGDDRGLVVDIATDAAVQLNDAPASGAQTLVSAWQDNMILVRATLIIGWVMARAAIAYVDNLH